MSENRLSKISASIPPTAHTVVLQNYITTDQTTDLITFLALRTFAIKDLTIPNPIPEDSILKQTLYFAMALRNVPRILMNRLAFTLYDCMDRMQEAEKALTGAAVAGEMLVDGEGEVETVIDVNGQMEQMPIVWNGLFTGANKGKLITRVAN